MSVRQQREFFQQQLVEADSLWSLVSDHPIMGPQMKHRVEELQEQLDALPESSFEAKTTVYFMGEPVEGTRAIDAEFSSKALLPYLEMVKTQFAAITHGQVGRSGPRRREKDARLMITGTPRGSFGFELEAPRSDDLFAEEKLSETLVQLTQVIEAAGVSDLEYLRVLNDLEERSFPKLKEFFKVLHDNGAGIRLQTGDLEIEMPPSLIDTAYERTNESFEETASLTVEGIFRGARLETWDFNLRTDDGIPYTGRIDPDLEEDEVAAMNKRTNERCVADLRRITVTTGSGKRTTRFVLIDLR